MNDIENLHLYVATPRNIDSHVRLSHLCKVAIKFSWLTVKIVNITICLSWMDISNNQPLQSSGCSVRSFFIPRISLLMTSTSFLNFPHSILLLLALVGAWLVSLLDVSTNNFLHHSQFSCDVHIVVAFSSVFPHASLSTCLHQSTWFSTYM